MPRPGLPPPAPLPPSSSLPLRDTYRHPSSFSFSSDGEDMAGHLAAFSPSPPSEQEEDEIFLPPRATLLMPNHKSGPHPAAHRTRSLDPPPPRPRRARRENKKARKAKAHRVAVDEPQAVACRSRSLEYPAPRTAPDRSLEYPAPRTAPDRSFTSLRVLRRRRDFDAPPPPFASDGDDDVANNDDDDDDPPSPPTAHALTTPVVGDEKAGRRLARSRHQRPILRHNSLSSPRHAPRPDSLRPPASAPPVLASVRHTRSTVVHGAPPVKTSMVPNLRTRSSSPLTGDAPRILRSRREEHPAKPPSLSGMSLVTADASAPGSPRSPRATPPSPAPVAPAAHVPPRLALRAATTSYVATPSPPTSPVSLPRRSKSTAASTASMFSTVIGGGGDVGASPIDTSPLSRVIRTPFAPLLTLTQAPLPCLPLRSSPLPMLVANPASMHLMATLLPRLLRLPSRVVEGVRGGLGVGVRNAVVWAGVRGERPRKVRAVTEREDAGVRVVLGGARGGVVDAVRAAAVREFGAKGFEAVVMLGCFAGYYGAVCGLLGVEEEGGAGDGVRASLNLTDFDDRAEKGMGGRGRREGLKLMKKVKDLRSIEAYWMAGVPEGEDGRCLGRILGFVPSYLECVKGREERRAFVFLLRWLVKGEAVKVVVRCLMGYVLARSADNVVLTAHWAYLVQRFGGEDASAMLDVVDDVGALIECRRRFTSSGRSTIGSSVTSGDERRRTRDGTEDDDEEVGGAEQVVRLADRPVVTEIDTEVDVTDGEDTGDESDFSMRSTEERMSDLRRMMDKRVPDRPVGTRIAGNAAFELEDESDEEKSDGGSGNVSDVGDAFRGDDDRSTFDANGMLSGIRIARELDLNFSDSTGADEEDEEVEEVVEEERFPSFPARSSTLSGAESGVEVAVSAETAHSAAIVADVFSKQDVAALLLAQAAARSARRSAASSRSSVPRMRLTSSEARMAREDLAPAAIAEAISVVGAHVALQRLTSTYRQVRLEDVVRNFVMGPVGHELNLNNVGETLIQRQPTSRRGWKKHSLRGVVEAERIL